MPRRERVEMHTFDLYHSPRAWGMSIIRTACPTQCWHESYLLAAGSAGSVRSLLNRSVKSH